MGTNAEGGQDVKRGARSAAERSWYRFSALSDAPTEADLYVYDFIGIDPWTGEGVGAKQFIDDLSKLPESVKAIKLHVNSPGGSVFDAVAIANALRAHPADVEASIEGVAASAATIIIMGAAVITIAENALVMIHNAVGFAWGTAKDMRAEAEALDRVQTAIVATYQWHSKLSADELVAMMDAVTWMDAEEAVANGFATEVGDAMKAAAHFDARVVAKLGVAPDKYQARLTAIVAESVDDEPAIEPEAPVAPEPTPEVARASNVVDITGTRERQIRDEEVTRCESIGRVFAAITKSHPELAGGIENLRRAAVQNRLTVEAASHSLTDLLADQGSQEITNAISPLPRPTPGAAAIDTNQIYAKLNQDRKRRNLR